MKRSVVGIPIGRKNKGQLLKEVAQVMGAGGRLSELRVSICFGGLDSIVIRSQETASSWGTWTP
jgi:hypothetical protein